MSRIIQVIAGHGGGDSGACAGGYTEANLVRRLAARMKALGGSSVQVLDTSFDWYGTGKVSTYAFAKGAVVVELHMDSGPSSARGGHVIVRDGLSADKYDKALAKFISGKFPGRSVTISKRSDLANINRAARRGVNYRLLECCFISNKSDRTEFVRDMDEVAAGIIEALGGKVSGKPSGKPSKPAEPEKPSKPKPSKPSGGIDLGESMEVWGPKFTKELERQRGTTVDGVISGQSEADAGHFWATEGTVRFGGGGSAVMRSLQKMTGAEADGYYGSKSIKAHQRWLNKTVDAGLKVDGYHGRATNRAMAKALMAGKYKVKR